MKRILSIFLTILLLACFTACTGNEDTVYFYYTPKAVSYGTDRDLLVAEKRGSLSREDDLSYLLSFYFQGPMDKDLSLPVPQNTQVLAVRRNGERLMLTMSPEFNQLKGMDLTLACSCIAQTCFSLTDVESVTFTTEANPQLNFTVTRDGLVLNDELPPKETTN